MEPQPTVCGPKPGHIWNWSTELVGEHACVSKTSLVKVVHAHLCKTIPLLRLLLLPPFTNPERLEATGLERSIFFNGTSLGLASITDIGSNRQPQINISHNMEVVKYGGINLGPSIFKSVLF